MFQTELKVDGNKVDGNRIRVPLALQQIDFNALKEFQMEIGDFEVTVKHYKSSETYTFASVRKINSRHSDEISSQLARSAAMVQLCNLVNVVVAENGLNSVAQSPIKVQVMERNVVRPSSRLNV